MFDLASKTQEINELLPLYLPKRDNALGHINEAMNYSVLNGGKRLRGIMLMEAYKLFSSDKDTADKIVRPFAAAIECIHAYSLVHDDLPSMDNDMYRRGQLTTHAKYGEAMGVLTGDALLNYATEIITSCQNSLYLYRNNEFVVELYARTSRAASVIFKKAGYTGMIGGQVLDVCEEFDSDNVSENIKYLMKLYQLKTSRLFEAALCAGAILGGADEKDIRSIEQLGYNIGIAFQIRDDILDITSSVEELGKDVGNDSKNSKHTIPALIGIEKSKELVAKLSDDAIAILDSLPGDVSFLKELTCFLISRNR